MNGIACSANPAGSAISAGYPSTGSIRAPAPPHPEVAELRSYKVTLDGLHLEAIDGFADVDGVLNLLPTYVTESVVGNICQFDTDDD